MTIAYTDPALVAEVAVQDEAPAYGRTGTGYGPKVPTRYRIRYAGRMRRVYAAFYGNSASLYVVAGGRDHCLDSGTEHRLEALRDGARP